MPLWKFGKFGALFVLALGVACDRSGARGGDAGADGAADSADASRGGDAGDAGAKGGDSGASTLGAADAGALDDLTIPPTSSDELTARAKHLLEAISAGNPELAVDILFPRDGFLGARDAADPGKVWEKKVSSVFRKQLLRLHKKKGMDRAQFVSIELGHAVTQVAPKRHEWKKPLWRVKGSHLNYVIDGKSYKVAITEMVAWRGAWYVTRLK